MADVRFHPEADEDYQGAVDWYLEHNPDAADRFETAVERALDDLRCHPRRWPMKDDRHRVRLIVGFPYAIVYRHVNDTVVVVAVAHSSRNPEYWTHRADEAANGHDE